LSLIRSLHNVYYIKKSKTICIFETTFLKILEVCLQICHEWDRTHVITNQRMYLEIEVTAILNVLTAH